MDSWIFLNFQATLTEFFYIVYMRENGLLVLVLFCHLKMGLKNTLACLSLLVEEIKAICFFKFAYHHRKKHKLFKWQP